MTSNKLSRRCRARANSGRWCRAAAMEGGLCFFHANPNKAAELGRIGGRNKGSKMCNDEPILELNTALSVQDMLARLFGDVHSGKVSPRVGATLTSLLSLQLRAIESTELEGCVGKLEKLIAATKTVEGTEVAPELDFDGLPGFGEISKTEKQQP